MIKLGKWDIIETDNGFLVVDELGIPVINRYFDTQNEADQARCAYATMLVLDSYK